VLSIRVVPEGVVTDPRIITNASSETERAFADGPTWQLNRLDGEVAVVEDRRLWRL
jgi:hypothetical protein